MPRAGTQRTNPFNVMRFAAAHPSGRSEMIRKVALRLFGKRGRYSWTENRRWIARQFDARERIAASDPDLWQEAIEFGRELRARAATILAHVPFDMGAGGDYEWLYWLTRYLKPVTIVETGVSAGWSSQAFLAAMERNGIGGALHSSDFPFFRVRDPERYVGILVAPELKSRWHLHTSGDRLALPQIVASTPQIDLFHYDSDKSWAGRDFAYRLVRPKLAGPFIMDDIADNSWFRECVERGGNNFDIVGRSGVIVPPGSSALKSWGSADVASA